MMVKDLNMTSEEVKQVLTDLHFKLGIKEMTETLNKYLEYTVGFEAKQFENKIKVYLWGDEVMELSFDFNSEPYSMLAKQKPQPEYMDGMTIIDIVCALEDFTKEVGIENVQYERYQTTTYAEYKLMKGAEE